MPQSVVIREVPKTRRKLRSPKHPFQVRHRPWQITPFLIAPVLPGETLRNLILQSRAVTDPIKSNLVGWWLEYYIFYVKMSDLDGRDTFMQMMLDQTTSLSAFDQAALVEYYHGTTTISWVKECLRRCVDYYFRTADESWDDHTIGNLPSMGIMQDSWLDSVQNDADRAPIADVDVDLDSNATITASEIDKAMWTWQLLRTQGMTNMSYEDYLRTYGVHTKAANLHKPELIRFIRDWTYPTVHVDASDGSPSSACVWKTNERADKDRFFDEAGFVFGVTIARPKVYLSKQAGTVTDLMKDLYTWLPAVLHDRVEASLKQVTALNAPLSANTDDYWVDLKDLFLYGEQYVNFALTETDAGLVALPTAALQKRYASSTDADALFASASPANQIRQDGVVDLAVSSTVEDTTQTV